MIPRFICPHCHNSLDPLTLEAADSAEAQYRVCPDCDCPIVFSVNGKDAEDSIPAPVVAVVPTVLPAESFAL